MRGWAFFSGTNCRSLVTNPPPVQIFCQLDQEHFFGCATLCSCIGTWLSEAVSENQEPEGGIGATDGIMDKCSTSIEER